MCAPLLAALRDAGHAVDAALSDRNAEIFAPGAVARRHVLERIPWPAHGSTPASAARARAGIAAAAYDIALIASEEPEAYELAAGIPRRVGFSTGWAKPFKSLWVGRRVTTAVRRAARAGGERAHEAAIVFRLGAGLHAEPAPTRDPARLRPLLVAGPPPERRAIVVQLGTTWQTLGLDRATCTATVAALAARGARFVASASERAAAAALAGDVPVTVFDALAPWKGALDRARVVVTPDTGAAHLAGMLGIPVVDLFPDAGAAARIARWHPWASRYVALTARDVRGGGGARRIERACDEL